MTGKRVFPERHEHSTLEAISETFFRNHLPPSWIIDKPVDFGIDLNVTPVINGNVLGLNFSVQLKAQNDTKGKLETRLKKTTLNYLFNRLEPIMIVLYDKKTNRAYWKWLIQDDFDLTKNVLTYSVRFSIEQTLSIIDWQTVCDYVQRIFKVKNRLLTSLEFDLFNTDSEPEIKAWAHFVNHNYQEAILYFRRLIQQPSPKPIWLLALAQSEYQIYDYTNALIDINKVLDVDKDDNILLTKGCILAEDGIRHNDVHKLREAEKIFEDLYQRNPSATHAYNYANTASKLGKLDLAEELYKTSLNANPNYAEAWKNLGQLYYDLGKHELEMKCYENALRIDPELMQAKASKAITAGVIYKQYRRSIKVLLECVDQSRIIHSEFPQIYYWLGLFYLKVGKVHDALDWINKGLNNNPGNRHLINLKAQVFFENMEKETTLIPMAVSFFNENYRLNKDDSVNFYLLCKSLEKNNERQFAFDSAISWLKSRPFVEAFRHDSKILLSFEEVLIIIGQWKLIQDYSFRYPIANVSAHLEYAEISSYEKFIYAFEIKRMVFLANIGGQLEAPIKEATLKNKAKELGKKILLDFDESVICGLITTPKSDTTNFAKQFATVLDLLSTIVFTEYTRCISFSVGHKQPNEKHTIEDTIDKSFLTEALLYYAEIIYRNFGLPMGGETNDNKTDQA